MSAMDQYTNAIFIAGLAHAGQVDKVGQPYIDHPIHVVELLYAMGGENIDMEMAVAAMLHDVVEDTNITLDALRSLQFNENVVGMVDLLTHRRGQSRAEYVYYISRNEKSTLIKTADVLDNMNHARLATLNIETRNRLISKYTTTLLDLGYFAAEVDDMLIEFAGWPEPVDEIETPA